MATPCFPCIADPALRSGPQPSPLPPFPPQCWRGSSDYDDCFTSKSLLKASMRKCSRICSCVIIFRTHGAKDYHHLCQSHPVPSSASLLVAMLICLLFLPQPLPSSSSPERDPKVTDVSGKEKPHDGESYRPTVRRESIGGMEWRGAWKSIMEVWNCIMGGCEF